MKPAAMPRPWRRLLDAGAPSLEGWYADPMQPALVEGLLESTRHEFSSRLCRGDRCFQLQVLRLICHYWQGRLIDMDYAHLVAIAGDDQDRALLDLVYGQLLMSRKRKPADRYLAAGFAAAVEGLGASAYFRLVRRHELLGYLPLSETLSQPLNLKALLREAAVIKCLQGGNRTRTIETHYDTVG